MLYGLLAAVGWGLADYEGAVAGRKIGSLPTVLVAQATATAAVWAFFLAGGHDAAGLGSLAGLIVLNGVASAGAYLTHYRALELGPVAVVSPIGATYALVGVILAVVVLGERPGPIVIAGGIVVVVGVMLTSTDLAKLRSGTHTMPPGVPWAVVSAVLFGIGGFLLAYLAREAGWVTGLWASRNAQLVAFAAIGFANRRSFDRVGWNRGIAVAVAAGVADLLGVTSYSYGAQEGYVSVVLIASAVFPLIAVVLSVLYLHERPVPNQYVGIGLTIAGLILLGLG
jgi:drug/metabolite transporter (DMT)-like permease